MEKGAKVTLCNKKGETVIDLAKATGNPELIDLCSNYSKFNTSQIVKKLKIHENLAQLSYVILPPAETKTVIAGVNDEFLMREKVSLVSEFKQNKQQRIPRQIPSLMMGGAR